MLQNCNENLLIRAENVKEITLCFSKLFHQPLILLVETYDGRSLVFNQNFYLSVDSFGYSYFQTNNMKLKTPIEDMNKISRIAFCTTRFLKRRIIEIIEFTDGITLISPLVNSIDIEKIDANYIALQVRQAMSSLQSKT